MACGPSVFGAGCPNRLLSKHPAPAWHLQLGARNPHVQPWHCCRGKATGSGCLQGHALSPTVWVAATPAARAQPPSWEREADFGFPKPTQTSMACAGGEGAADSPWPGQDVTEMGAAAPRSLAWRERLEGSRAQVVGSPIQGKLQKGNKPPRKAALVPARQQTQKPGGLG